MSSLCWERLWGTRGTTTFPALPCQAVQTLSVQTTESISWLGLGTGWLRRPGSLRSVSPVPLEAASPSPHPWAMVSGLDFPKGPLGCPLVWPQGGPGAEDSKSTAGPGRALAGSQVSSRLTLRDSLQRCSPSEPRDPDVQQGPQPPQSPRSPHSLFKLHSFLEENGRE